MIQYQQTVQLTMSCLVRHCVHRQINETGHEKNLFQSIWHKANGMSSGIVSQFRSVNTVSFSLTRSKTSVSRLTIYKDANDGVNTVCNDHLYLRIKSTSN